MLQPIGLVLVVVVSLAWSAWGATVYSTFAPVPPGSYEQAGVSGAYNWNGVLGGTANWASGWSFVAPSTTTIVTIEAVLLKHPLLPANPATLELAADNGGVPGTVLSSGTVGLAAWTVGGLGTVAVTLNPGADIVSGTTYWLVTRAADGMGYMHALACQVQSPPGVLRLQKDGGAWVTPAIAAHVFQHRDAILEHCAPAFRLLN